MGLITKIKRADARLGDGEIMVWKGRKKILSRKARKLGNFIKVGLSVLRRSHEDLQLKNYPLETDFMTMGRRHRRFA
jgi:hypothetical protein